MKQACLHVSDDKEKSEEKRNDNTVSFEGAFCGDDAAVSKRIQNSDEAICAEADDGSHKNVARETEKLNKKNAKRAEWVGKKVAMKYENEERQFHEQIDDIKVHELLIFARQFLVRAQQVNHREDIQNQA